MGTPLPVGRPRERNIFAALFADRSPLDLRIVGRTLIHAAFVGVAAGLVGVLFFGALEIVEGFLLGRLAGYERLRAYGETFSIGPEGGAFRPWLLLVIPGFGALLGGMVSRFAPETQGGGGDAMIEAFHHQGGAIRRRVIWVKAIGSMFTLGAGGAGGREGPTMQIGAAIGSLVGRTLRVGTRERRILMIAGVAAGMSAIFRTPLGAALLATEVLYRDDFEADALIPALLASVVSYSVFISFYGESTLFAHAPRYPFIPAHLPLYGLLALMVAALAAFFVQALSWMKKTSNGWNVPLWVKPAIGGLLLGLFCTPILYLAGRWLGRSGQGLGLLGGGYGAVQTAISGADWLPVGWRSVELLLLLTAAKLLASTLTIGTGGSAGDFAPSLVLGGLFGGAFGRAAQLLLHDPRIDPGAFVLVGMGTFYGGVAHVPVSALVMVCELAGSYDLLVPLMLSMGIAFAALRRVSLYHAQLGSQRDSPAHPVHMLDILKGIFVKDVMIQGRPFVSFEPSTPAAEMLRRVADTSWQDVFPVLDAAGKMLGFVTSDSLRIVAAEPELALVAVAADAMLPAVSLRGDDTLRAAAEAFVAHGVREIPVLDDDGKIAGFIDEADIGKSYLDATNREEEPRSTQVPRDSHASLHGA
ncbi:MAG TPA: chloride channel protein [Minicystis sp.]|nr:chloride channel protein [Minicystis sp.]